MTTIHRHQRHISVFFLATYIPECACRISSKRSLLLAENASRTSRNESEQTKTYDYISIFGSQQDTQAYSDIFSMDTQTRTSTTASPETTKTSQQDTSVIYSDFFTAHTQNTTSTTETLETNKTILQSLHKLINQRPDLVSVSDDPTSIMLLRRESTNSFLDGMSAMDDSGPNARDVSNAFGNGPSSILNSFAA